MCKYSELRKFVKKILQNSYRLPKAVNDSVNQILSIFITSMKVLAPQIKAFDNGLICYTLLMMIILYEMIV